MFENNIPSASIVELVNLIRNGQLQDNIPRAIRLSLWIAGSTVETFFPTITEMMFAQEVNNIQSVSQRIIEQAPAESDVQASAMNVDLLIAIAQLASLLLQGKK